MRLQIADSRLQIVRAALVILVLGLLASVPAQTRLGYLAVGSPHGIFVMLGTTVASKALPAGNVAGYRVERRPYGAGEWTALADVQGPASEADFRSRLATARRHAPEPADLKDATIADIWRRAAASHDVDSLRFPGQLLEVRLALGVLWLDSAATRDREYEYRVSQVDRTGSARPTWLSGRAHWPMSVDFNPMRVTRSRADDSTVSITWRSVGKMRGCSFRVMRDAAFSGRFEPVPLGRFVSGRGDTTDYSLDDRSVEPGVLYRYFALPFCRYGNFGRSSETTLVASYNFKSLRLPSEVRAESAAGGIRLSWQLERPDLVKSIKVLRSDKWDGEYAQLAEIPSALTEWLDQTAPPSVQQFYYLVLTGHLGEESPPTARVFAIYQSAEPPERPYAVMAEPVPGGVSVSWDLADADLQGCYVWRVDPLTGRAAQVSDLLPIKAERSVFTDTSSSLLAEYNYGYTVRAVSASRVVGAFSETAYARPQKPTRPPAVLGLSAAWEDDAVRIYWTDMQPFDRALDGYHVLRRTGQGKLVRLTDSLLPARRNGFVDTTAQPGKNYGYAVQAWDIFGAAGDTGALVAVTVAQPVPPAPAGLRGRSVPGGIELTWDPPFGPEVTGYRIYRYVRGSGPARVAKLDASTEGWTDSNAAKGILYFYYVTSLGVGDRESGPGSEVGVRR
jgi:hypothetical protein